MLAGTELLCENQKWHYGRILIVRKQHNSCFFANTFGLLKQTGQEFLEDKAPQLGAALAYYTVFSLAPLILVLVEVLGIIFRNDPAGAWSKITEQMNYFLGASAVQVVQNIAQQESQPGKSTTATIMGVALALFGASGVFGQLQDALNTIWDVKAKPSRGIWGFLRNRFLSFAMVLLWVYYSSQILLFGAEFTQVYADRAGREVEPSEYAVRVEQKEVESR
jgi:membrane protein